jgi:hypothetical protein
MFKSPPPITRSISERDGKPERVIKPRRRALTCNGMWAISECSLLDGPIGIAHY